MNAGIPREIIDEILDRTDITALIESYLPLKRQGRNMVGLCPFHLEDTPSFSVSPDKQMYYCFGCQKGGNAISFVMEYEHLSFVEAVRKLAEKAGVTIPERELTPGQKRAYDEKRRLTEINKAAAAYYYHTLEHSAPAQAYLKKRGITSETAAQFQLGYAEDSWDKLYNYLRQKGFSEPDMVKAGVINKAESGKCFDRFRGRLMFPICDKKGDCIAFSGRVLDNSLPKYLNTAETPVFHKGKNIFALHLAYTAIRREEEAILLEGNIDVVTAHMYGADNTVAPLGTAFTEDHAKILKRYCKRVIVAFDGDGAGQRATNKALDILMRTGIRPYAMTIPAPYDPDEYLRNFGKEGWDNLKKSALTYMDFKIRLAEETYNPQTAEGKADILSELGPSLLMIKDIVERSEYIHTISDHLNISEDLLRLDIQRKISAGRSDFGAGMDLTGKKNQRGASVAKSCILYYAAEKKEVFEEIDSVTGWSFAESGIQQIIVRVIREHKEEYSWKFRDLVELAPEQYRDRIYTYIMHDPFTAGDDRDAAFRGCWKTVRRDSLKREKELLQEKIKECEKSGNNDELIVLLEKFSKIQQDLRNI